MFRFHIQLFDFRSSFYSFVSDKIDMLEFIRMLFLDNEQSKIDLYEWKIIW